MTPQFGGLYWRKSPRTFGESVLMSWQPAVNEAKRRFYGKNTLLGSYASGLVYFFNTDVHERHDIKSVSISVKNTHTARIVRNKLASLRAVFKLSKL